MRGEPCKVQGVPYPRRRNIAVDSVCSKPGRRKSQGNCAVSYLSYLN